MPDRCRAGRIDADATQAATTPPPAASAQTASHALSLQPSQHREARHRQHTHRHRAQQQQNAVRMADRAGGLRHAQEVRREDPEHERQRDRTRGGPGHHRAVTSRRVGAVARRRRRRDDGFVLATVRDHGGSRRRRRRARDPGCDHGGRRPRGNRRRRRMRDVRSGRAPVVPDRAWACWKSPKAPSVALGSRRRTRRSSSAGAGQAAPAPRSGRACERPKNERPSAPGTAARDLVVLFATALQTFYVLFSKAHHTPVSSLGSTVWTAANCHEDRDRKDQRDVQAASAEAPVDRKRGDGDARRYRRHG